MSTISKLKDFFRLNDSAEYDPYEEYDEVGGGEYQSSYPAQQPQPQAEREVENQNYRSEAELRSTMNSNTNNVVGMPASGKWWGGVAEVIVIEPHAFEEMPQVVQALRERKSVVLNLTMMDPDQAQRAVDFVAGATYTIDGHQERIGESIFLFTPSCVQVSTQSGVVHEVNQPTPAPRTPATAWTGDPVASRFAQ